MGTKLARVVLDGAKNILGLSDNKGGIIPLDTPTASEIVVASRLLSIADDEKLLKCNSASPVILTIPVDLTGLWVGTETVGAYQVGTGAVSFAAGAGVTLRGNVPTPTQYLVQGIVRVGANEWAYI